MGSNIILFAEGEWGSNIILFAEGEWGVRGGLKNDNSLINLQF